MPTSNTGILLYRCFTIYQARIYDGEHTKASRVYAKGISTVPAFALGEKGQIVPLAICSSICHLNLIYHNIVLSK